MSDKKDNFIMFVMKPDCSACENNEGYSWICDGNNMNDDGSCEQYIPKEWEKCNYIDGVWYKKQI